MQQTALQHVLTSDLGPAAWLGSMRGDAPLAAPRLTALCDPCSMLRMLAMRGGLNLLGILHVPAGHIDKEQLPVSAGFRAEAAVAWQRTMASTLCMHCLPNDTLGLIAMQCSHVDL